MVFNNFHLVYFSTKKYTKYIFDYESGLLIRFPSIFFSGKQQKVGSVRIGNAKLSDGPGVLKTSGQLPRSSSNSSKGFQIYQETENNPPPSTSGELRNLAIFFFKFGLYTPIAYETKSINLGAVRKLRKHVFDYF